MPSVKDPRSEATNQRISIQKNTISINGRSINTTTSPNTAKIYRGLLEYGVSPGSSGLLNDSALILMEELGCAISGEPRDFILTDDDTTSLGNEELVNPSLSAMKPEAMDATDSFTDENDPFYKLDDEIPQNLQAQREEEETAMAPSYVVFAATMASGKTERPTGGFLERGTARKAPARGLPTGAGASPSADLYPSAEGGY